MAARFKTKFGIDFSQPQLILTALKHRSYLNVTNEPRIFSNERLEFLGDAVTNLVVTEFLYRKFPKKTEGQLSKVKSILVSKPVMAEIAAGMSLGEMLLINWGEEKTGGRQRISLLGDAFEAVVGAIYLDQGMETARRFIERYLLKDYQKILKRGLYKNYKSILLEYAQSTSKQPPEYRVVEESGPDHAKQFTVEVWVNGQKLGQGTGRSKKLAEQQAARQAIEKLGISPGDQLEK
ncbi:MAG: ribonuclease III [Calditrichaeota bacterium]|nr:MAG: ribonuclease III [Calditrichota bacterium]